jgi:hypothetical protein
MDKLNNLSGFNDNPFLTRDDMLVALKALFTPIEPFLSSGKARISLGVSGATFLVEPAELEGFARPLWGLIPLADCDPQFPNWDIFREGFKNGTDPDHSEFWGYTGDKDQRLVELAIFGYALAAIPEIIWDPLDEQAKANLAKWMNRMNYVEIFDNNFWFFRVLVNVGLDRVGIGGNQAVLKHDLQKIEDLYQEGGWYSDGHGPQFDYYNPWAMHYYGLIYAMLVGDKDPETSRKYRERAEAFAKEFIHWFTRDGSTLPFGRSLTYRFCQAAFWGALAYAGIEAVPWGVMKGLVLRHLRWWAGQPILDTADLLSIGYAYPCLNMAEGYNSPMSPYWAFKLFIPLALSDDHPFWASEELPLPDLPEVTVQSTPGMIMCRDDKHDHLFALSQRQYARGDVIPEFRHAVPKYCKFAYSSAFGFSVPADRIGLGQGAYDNALAISDDGIHYRTREKSLDFKIEGQSSYSLWDGGPGVSVETWLVPCVPWHIRIHHVRTDQLIQTAEGGFSINRDGIPSEVDTQGCWAKVVYPHSFGGLLDLPLGVSISRTGQVIQVEPNTNVLFPRTFIPTLIGELEPGEHWLLCAVIGLPDSKEPNVYWDSPPEAVLQNDLVILSYKGKEIYRQEIS